MKKKYSAIIVPCIKVVLLICFVFVANIIMTELVESTNIVCRGQKFSSVEQAMQVMEASFREENDTSLDFCPPYKIVHHFEYEDNTIVLHSYCDTYDGEDSESLAVQVLNHNDDGTLSFGCGFATFRLSEPIESEDYYYFTNIKTSKGKKSISFLYLSKDSDKEIYIDGNKTEKELVVTQDDAFYICYAISKRDTFLSNLFTPIEYRHEIVVK